MPLSRRKSPAAYSDAEAWLEKTANFEIPSLTPVSH
jgi:hypothetical protein